MHRQTLRTFVDHRHIGVHPQVDTGLAHFRGDEFAHVVVEATQYLLAPIQLRHLCTQAVEDGCELAGDVATTHNDQTLRKRFEVEDGVRHQHMLLARDVRHERYAAGGDQDVAGAHAAAVDLHLLRTGDPCTC